MRLFVTAERVLQAWMDTTLEFRRRDGGAAALRVDLRRSPAARLSRRLGDLGLPGPFAVVTADNPGALAGGALRAAPGGGARLRALLAARGILDPVCVAGVSRDGAHREEGLAVPWPEEEAVDLAAALSQDGIYFWDGERFFIVGTRPRGPGRLPLPARKQPAR